MSEVVVKKRKKNVYFWRSLGYLAPYRRIVTISIVSAFFMGIIYTSGLGAVLPILRVLVNGDTVAGWMDRQVVEQRMGVTFSIADRSIDAPQLPDDRTILVLKLKQAGPAQTIGLAVNDKIVAADGKTSIPDIIADLAQPDRTTASITTQPGGVVHIGNLPKLRWYMGVGRSFAHWLPAKPLPTIATIFFIIMGLGMVGNVFRFMQEYLSDKAAISAINDIRRHMYDHVLHIPMEFFGTSGTSDVTSRLVQDSQTLQDGVKIVLGQSIQEPIKALFAFAFSVWLSWKLTFFIILFAPIMAQVVRKFGKKMRRASRAMLERSSHMLGQIESTLIGIRVVKGANAKRSSAAATARSWPACGWRC